MDFWEMNLNLTDTRYSEDVSQASSRESEFFFTQFDELCLELTIQQLTPRGAEVQSIWITYTQLY